MSTTTPSTSETSVTFSLAELAKIEQERVREEEAQRARAREKRAREQQEAEARRLAAENAQLAAEAEARARRLREEAAEKARLEARERAAADVARIEAEAKARLEADNAARAHELAVLRVRAETGNRRLVAALAVALGLAICGGGAAAYDGSRRVAALTHEADQLREGQQALAREREHAKATELAALDRRHAALRARPLVREAEEARVTAEAARNAVDPKALDHDRLRAFGDALDALEARIDTLEKLAQLDRRQADLAAWAGERRRGDAAAAVKAAATRAKAAGDESAIRAYETALDKLRDWLAKDGAGPRKPVTTTTTGAGSTSGSCLPGEPGCDLNGNRTF